MENHFKDISVIEKSMNLLNKKKNILDEKVFLRDHIKWIRVQEYGSYMYKDTLDQNTPFLQVNILKNRHKKIDEDTFTLELIKNKSNSLSEEKIANLKEQIKFVHEEYRYFYEKIIDGHMKENKGDVGKGKKRKSC